MPALDNIPRPQLPAEPSLQNLTMETSTETLLTIQDQLDQASVGSLPKLYERRREAIMHVRHFWLTALLSHPAFSLIITASDTQLLRHLAHIDLTTYHNGFELSFTFGTNKYFSSTTLSKRYTHTDAGRTITPAKIAWSPPLKSPRTGFFYWLNDSRDSAQLGELIQEHVFPHAIELYFGTYDA